MTPQLEQVLKRLAAERSAQVRREYNKTFIGVGPGAEFERYKALPATVAMLAEEAVLAEYAGLPPYK